MTMKGNEALMFLNIFKQSWVSVKESIATAEDTLQRKNYVSSVVGEGLSLAMTALITRKDSVTYSELEEAYGEASDLIVGLTKHYHNMTFSLMFLSMHYFAQGKRAPTSTMVKDAKICKAYGVEANDTVLVIGSTGMETVDRLFCEAPGDGESMAVYKDIHAIADGATWKKLHPRIQASVSIFSLHALTCVSGNAESNDIKLLASFPASLSTRSPGKNLSSLTLLSLVDDMCICFLYGGGM